MAKLPKALIKKYGISKKAWAVFRGQKHSHSSTRKVISVAKRKGKSKSRGNSIMGFNLGGLSKLAKPALSGVVVGAALAYVPDQYNTRGIRLATGIIGTAFAPSPFNGPAELLLGMEVAAITASKMGQMPGASSSSVTLN